MRNGLEAVPSIAIMTRGAARLPWPHQRRCRSTPSTVPRVWDSCFLYLIPCSKISILLSSNTWFKIEWLVVSEMSTFFWPLYTWSPLPIPADMHRICSQFYQAFWNFLGYPYCSIDPQSAIRFMTMPCCSSLMDSFALRDNLWNQRNTQYAGTGMFCM